MACYLQCCQQLMMLQGAAAVVINKQEPLFDHTLQNR